MYEPLFLGHPNKRGDSMTYIDAKIKNKFDELTPDVQEAIRQRNVRINNMQDLIKVLEDIVAEG